MLIPKKNRVAIYSQLFKDGVCVVKKDSMLKEHLEMKEIPNLHVMQTMKSLRSREYVRETFSWQYYYYYLTDEGIEYLRSYLNLPSTVKPTTLNPPPRQPARSALGRGDRPRRSYGDGGDKKMGPGGDFRPSYREGGGFGRGGPIRKD
ncbi:40S ribosomal protein S10 [Gracilariopsis chorda]|uniref:40S ribosomal protein S10 n=1 Tax=Gracilariopsis chorda TaxID=448386 RepID=A0A2V3J625_9FLOR|nr:40S ribosomal protein S10 [Gracilariopsis chorda]|eukprot:PXF49865.1 40S ribosomal protein S10 [Gracilariopsis chorda]